MCIRLYMRQAGEVVKIAGKYGEAAARERGRGDGCGAHLGQEAVGGDGAGLQGFYLRRNLRLL